MMRLTSVTCGSVSLSVSPGGRSHTCKGRVCFGGFIFFFFSKRAAHRGEMHLRGQSALCGLAGVGARQRLASCSRSPVIWGDGPSKKLVLG